MILTLVMQLATATVSSASVPLKFSEISSETRVLDSAEITCNQVMSPPLCKLKRSSVAGIPFTTSIVNSNASTGRVTMIYISWSRNLWDDMLVKALSEKYGPPSDDRVSKQKNRLGGEDESRHVEWSRFSDGRVTLIRDERDVSVMVSFSGNAEKPPPAKVDF